MNGLARRADPAGGSKWALTNTVAAMLSSFLSFALVARWLGTDQLGVLALATAALFPLRFSELGLAAAVTRYVAAQRGPAAQGSCGHVVRLSWLVSLGAFGLLDRKSVV